MTSSIRYALVILLFLPACSTVQSVISNVAPDYQEIPADSMRETAVRFEQDVLDGVRDPEISDLPGLKLNTDEIKQILTNRAARVHLIQEFLDTGHGREQKNGKVAIIRTKAYRDSKSKQQKDRDALFIISENRNRDSLYTAIQETNQLSPAGRVAVIKTFVQARIQLMKEGQKYEDESGDTQIK